MLSECRLKREEALLAHNGSQCDTISTKEQTSDAVGPTLVLQLQIEGVPVEAIVDTGSQSMVISRAVLREVGKHLHQQGREMPQLRVPTEYQLQDFMAKTVVVRGESWTSQQKCPLRMKPMEKG